MPLGFQAARGWGRGSHALGAAGPGRRPSCRATRRSVPETARPLSALTCDNAQAELGLQTLGSRCASALPLLTRPGGSPLCGPAAGAVRDRSRGPGRPRRRAWVCAGANAPSPADFAPLRGLPVTASCSRHGGFPAAAASCRSPSSAFALVVLARPPPGLGQPRGEYRGRGVPRGGTRGGGGLRPAWEPGWQVSPSGSAFTVTPPRCPVSAPLGSSFAPGDTLASLDPPVRPRTWLRFIGGGSSLVVRMSLGAGPRGFNPVPRGPVPSGRWRRWPRLRPHLSAVHSGPGPGGQSGFLETQAAQPPSGRRPRGPLPRGRGARAEGRSRAQGHRGTRARCFLTQPTRPGPASAARAPRRLSRHPGVRLLGRGPALARVELGPLFGPVQVTRSCRGRAAAMTGCVHTCVCCS